MEVKFEVSKIDSAIVQLDRAIRLFLDHQAFIPAITLAGAAEEIFGKAVGDRAVYGPLKQKLASDYSMPEGMVARDHLNKARNWSPTSKSKTEAPPTVGEVIAAEICQGARYKLKRLFVQFQADFLGCRETIPVLQPTLWKFERGIAHRERSGRSQSMAPVMAS